MTLLWKAADYTIDLGSVAGKQGERRRVEVVCDRLFRGYYIRFHDHDTAEHDGSGSVIHDIIFNGKSQMIGPEGVPVSKPTRRFVPQLLSDGWRLDTLTKGQQIIIDVEFLTDCTWRGEIAGKAMPPDYPGERNERET